MTTSAPMILLDDVSVIQNGTAILEKVGFAVGKGEFVYLVGPSGAGKSTILRLIHCEIPPTSGRVIVRDTDTSRLDSAKIPYLRRSIGYIFQDYKLLRDKTAYENVAFALEVTGVRGRTVKQKALQALQTVGMSHRLTHYPENLSGGECQRVAIARAIVLEPFILLADEPTGNLDDGNTKAIIDLLEHINHAGTAVLMATHKPQFVRRHTSSRVISIQSGRIV